ncbi:MAG: hypothetical protein SFZ03_05120 [Candidatus Melainabacteria bacterium]|nr:hypothetical protein [Candidatus Melainabacteria bacterium]
MPNDTLHIPLTSYPRMTLRCQCGNEFFVNVTRFRSREVVQCQICGATFPEDLGVQFFNALQELFEVKHQLETRNNGFHIAFTYKSTMKQPPAPCAFIESDFERN